MAKEIIGEKMPVPLSKAVRAGDFVYCSGEMPFNEKGEVVAGGIEAQTRAVMERLKGTLAKAGCTMADVVKSTVFITDTRDFGGMNKVYAEYFPDNPPARSTIRCDLVIDARIEIELVAYKPR